MEDTLGVADRKLILEAAGVLILVLMEDTLGEILDCVYRIFGSLNPCSNGRYSRRQNVCSSRRRVCEVLILVLMEDTLGAAENAQILTMLLS